MVFVADARTNANHREHNPELRRIRKKLRLTIGGMAKELTRLLDEPVDDSRWKNWEYDVSNTVPAHVLNVIRQMETDILPSGSARGFAVRVAIAAYRGVMAGDSYDDEAFYEREDEPTEVPTAFLIGGLDKIDQHELVKVNGTSMSPRIWSGDKVVIYKDPTPLPKTIVFCESPTGQLFLKRLVKGPARLELASYHPNGLHVSDIAGWKIHGHAIAIIGSPEQGSRNIEWNDGAPLRD